MPKLDAAAADIFIIQRAVWVRLNGSESNIMELAITIRIKIDMKSSFRDDL